MTVKPIRVLLIEDNPGDARFVRDMLTEANGTIELLWVESLTAGVARLAQEAVDVILLDLGLPESIGLDTLHRLTAQVPTLPAVVVMSGLADEDIAVRAVHGGAQDYLIKGKVDGALLIRALRYAIERRRTAEELRQTHGELEHRVQERTAALSRAIEALHEEIAERQRAEDAHLQLAAIVESANDSILSVSLDGVILSWNHGAETLYGYTAAEAIGRPISMLIPPERPAEIAQMLEQIRRGENIRHFETQRLRKDGSLIDIALSISPMRDTDGKIVRASAIARDISERKHAEAALREQESKIRRLVESNIIGIFFFDLDGQITDANDAFLQIVGYTREDLAAGRINWMQMTPPAYRIADESAIAEAMRSQSGGCTPYEKEYIRKDGRPVPVLMGGALLEGSQQRGIAFVLDLTERKQAEERIRYMAHHDALTGLPNRLLFRDRVGQAIGQARRDQHQVAVLFVDLDHFKDINDSLGHQVGDRLLRVMARRLQRCLRQGDSVARLGGDEFVISLPALAGDDDVMQVAGKILETLRQPFLVDHHELHVTGSIGISLYPTDGQDAEALMRAADTAMYHAKERGRDNYQFFTPRLNEAAQRRLTIANRLHQAIQRHEFLLYYQPQVDLVSGRVSAAEALLRWKQANNEIVLPNEFIHIAEDSGLIVPLGEWVLRQACEQLQRWRGAGHPDLRIAVNLSPHQFRRPGFPEFAARTLKEFGLPATALDLEITEGILMMQSQENLANLEQLARMGVYLAVDDFGTGYSSLAYLQRFPIHALKIDQSFVDGIGEDPNDTTIVNAIIAMAESLNLKVVAEGVESAKQMVFLKAHGCFAVQGFYFSPAVPADDFTELLRAPFKLAAGS